MKKILFLFLCLALPAVFAQAPDYPNTSDTNTDNGYVPEDLPHDVNRDISSEMDDESDQRQRAQIERKTEQDSQGPENVSEEDEDL